MIEEHRDQSNKKKGEWSSWSVTFPYEQDLILYQNSFKVKSPLAEKGAIIIFLYPQIELG